MLPVVIQANGNLRSEAKLPVGKKTKPDEFAPQKINNNGGSQKSSPEENGLVCERDGIGVRLLPPRGGQAIVAESPLGWHGDDGGRVLAIARVLAEAAGDLGPSWFLHRHAESFGHKRGRKKKD